MLPGLLPHGFLALVTETNIGVDVAAGLAVAHAAARQRPLALPSRLSEIERMAHEALIAGLGEKALWGYYSEAENA